LQRVVVEDVQIGFERMRSSSRLGRCGSPGYDLGDGRRRWRALDLGATLAFVEADAPRVTCRRHGVVVCAVPWARHRSRVTRAFEDQAAWLAVNTSKSAVAELMRVAWRTVGGICERVCTEAQREVDLLDGLRRIGIDEISHGWRADRPRNALARRALPAAPTLKTKSLGDIQFTSEQSREGWAQRPDSKAAIGARVSARCSSSP